jgi:hypothetical protein
MPKEAAAGFSQGGLVYLKYTFRYRDQFDEPNDDWLNCVEATSDELLGAYTRAEDDAMTLAFGGRGKKRLNKVFDVIGFLYLDYCYPSRKQGKKRKVAASAISATLKGKKIKVLTHQPRYIEMARVPNLAEGNSSDAEIEYPAPAGAKGESAKGPKAMGQEKTEPAEAPKCPVEAKEKTAEESARLPKILSPPPEQELPMVSKVPAITPKRRRMASVLDVDLESTRAPTPASANEVAEAATTRVEVEAGPSVPIEIGPVETIEQDIEQGPSETTLILEKEGASKKVKSPTPEAFTKELDFIIRHTSGKQLLEEQIAEAKHYAMELKYPKGSMVYNGTDEDDFLYCLTDNKEISVCREMARNIGFPKLDVSLSSMSKDDLADSLTYNSLKVKMFRLINTLLFASFMIVLIPPFCRA